MKSYSEILESDNDKDAKKATLEMVKKVEELLESSFSFSAIPHIKFTSYNGSILYNFYLMFKYKNDTPSDWVRMSNKLKEEVESHFKRIDDQGLEPLLGSDIIDQHDVVCLSFGVIDLENSELFKSAGGINKYKL